jgi:hypothetical protein
MIVFKIDVANRNNYVKLFCEFVEVYSSGKISTKNWASD